MQDLRELVNPLHLGFVDPIPVDFPFIESLRTTHSIKRPLLDSEVYILAEPWSQRAAVEISLSKPKSLSLYTNESPWFIPEIHGLSRLVIAPQHGSTKDDADVFRNPELVEVDLSTDGCVRPLRADLSTNLESLTLWSRSDMSTLAGHPSLEVLKIGMRTAVTPKWFKGNTRLKTLDLQASSGPGIDFDFAAEVPELRHVSVDRCRSIDGVQDWANLASLDADVRTGSNSLHALRSSSQLRYLRIKAKGTLDLRHLTACSSLQVLIMDIQQDGQDEPIDLAPVLGLPNLSVLTVSCGKLPVGFDEVKFDAPALALQIYPKASAPADLSLLKKAQPRLRSLIVGGRLKNRHTLSVMANIRKTLVRNDTGWHEEVTLFDESGNLLSPGASPQKET